MADTTTRTPWVAYTAVAAVILQWLTFIGFAVLDYNYAEQLHPISYFATRPNTQRLFTIGFTSSAILVWIFVTFWARKHIKISFILFTLSMGFFIAMATIPFNPDDIQNLVQHENVTALFALTYVLGMLHVGVRNREAGLRRRSLICGAIGIILGITIFNTDNAVNKTSIIFYEIICALAAQYWILYVSKYIIQKQPKKDPVEVLSAKAA